MTNSTPTFHALASRVFTGPACTAYKLAKKTGLPIIHARQDGSLSVRYYQDGRRRSRHYPKSRVEIHMDGGEPFFLLDQLRRLGA